MPVMSLDGGCLCGAIRYHARAYHRVVNCHCGMCSKATGAAFATWVCIAEKDFQMTGAEPVFRRSSPGCVRGFCASCGSALFMKYDADDEMTVSLGSLDEPERVRPEYGIWVSSRLTWVAPVDEDLPQFVGNPD